MNPRLTDLEPSLIRAINARKRPADLDLGLGEPVLAPDPEPLRRATEWLIAHGCRYSPNLGFDDVRAAVGEYLGLPGERCCLTHGSQEALYLALKTALGGPSDEVLVVEPGYPAYAKIARMEGLPVRSVGLDPDRGFQPDAARVLSALRPETRMVVLASPNNPTARVWPRAELDRLVAGLQDRWLVWDEVYRELCYVAYARPDYARTLWVGGLSKCSALTGLRLGWLGAPPELMPLVLRAHQLVTTAASTYAQRVALELLGEGGLARQLPAYRERRRLLLEALEEAHLEFVEPEGAFYCMIRVPPERGGSLAAAADLLDACRVVTVPGVAFGAEGWIRASWAGEPDTVREGLRRIAERFAGKAGAPRRDSEG
ncbi:MAG: pyridoxal phosphate-dependent aminotransferase [Candidatus Eremiobacterota bacterium]